MYEPVLLLKLVLTMYMCIDVEMDSKMVQKSVMDLDKRNVETEKHVDQVVLVLSMENVVLLVGRTIIALQVAMDSHEEIHNYVRMELLHHSRIIQVQKNDHGLVLE